MARPNPSLSQRSMTRRTVLGTGAALLAPIATASCGDDAPRSRDDASPDIDQRDASTDAGVDAQTDAGADTPNADGTDTGSDALPPDDAGPREDITADVPVEPAPRWPACDPEAATQTISFVHVNDIHADYTSTPRAGSAIALLCGYRNRVREENPFTVFTNGGDDFEKGSVLEQLTEGRSTLELARAMRFDVRCIGNHDFAWSEDLVLDYSQDDHALVLCANVDYIGPRPERWGALKFGILEVGCVRIGFFGMVSDPWNELNRQVSGDFFPNFPMRRDWAAQAQEIVDAHRDEVDLVVMCSHLGFGADQVVAQTTRGLDIILGAHSHTVLNTPKIVNGVIIIQAGSSADFIARLDVEFDLRARRMTRHDYRLELVLPQITGRDEDVQATVDALQGRSGPDILRPIGSIARNRDATEVAAVGARAARFVLETDAALGEPDLTWKTWSAGRISVSDCHATWLVERQPAGTPGFNSYYTATIRGDDLLRVRDERPEGWAWDGPESIDPATTYRLALQKGSALNPDVRLPAGVTLGDVSFGAETWSIVADWCRHRTANCLAIDEDTPVPGCTER